MNDLISVIVPVYKTELYLRKCVDSALYRQGVLILLKSHNK